MKTLNDLNQTFGIPEQITFIEGSAGLTKVILRHGTRAEAEIYLHGATVVAWRALHHGELLYLSKRAEYSPSKAIRGGIPLVFPQFGGGPLPSHGFARTSAWQVKSSRIQENGKVEIVLMLCDDEATRKLWPHRFTVEYSVILDDTLQTTFSVINNGTIAIEFQHALHTYFKIGDISKIEINGLSGVSYLDNLRDRALDRETNKTVRFSAEVDRIYQGAPDNIVLLDSSLGREINIVRNNMCDAVLWNPWVEKNKRLADMGPEDYREMVCVESGNIVPAVQLAAGQRFSADQVISIR